MAWKKKYKYFLTPIYALQKTLELYLCKHFLYEKNDVLYCTIQGLVSKSLQ